MHKKENNCSNCGSELHFNPKTQSLFCDNCTSTFEILKRPAIKKHYAISINNKIDVDEQRKITCKNCGVELLASKYEFANVCPYCSSAIIENNETFNAFKPDAIIPFRFNKQDIAKKYMELVKKKWYVPNKVKKMPQLSQINGIYIPAFTFDANTLSTYDGKLGINHTRTVNGKSRTYTTYRYIRGSEKVNFTDIVVESSSKISQIELAKIEPFNFAEQVQFNNDFIKGYAVEYFERTIDECKKQADAIMNTSIRRHILSKYHYSFVSYLNVNTTFNNEKYCYTLLPVYTIDLKYKKKNYTPLLNGQTGKIGKGLPKSAFKITTLVVSILLAIAIPLILILLNN